MNNNTIQINSYLQNEMSAEERAAFETRLANDKELQYELEVQRNILTAVLNAGLKGEFAKAIKQKIMLRRIIQWGAVIISSIVIVLVINYRQSIFSGKTSLSDEVDTAVTTSFINPPLSSVNVPFSEYSIDAERGETIFHRSGSIIYFPPSAFVDASGNIVKGNVKITYREFADPIDFYVSGISMQYDSAGNRYNFESSGMCEINAYKDNEAVFVNQQAKPQINLSGKNKSPLHNLYFLDTVARSWKYMGKDLITEVKHIAKQGPQPNTVTAFESDAIATRPLKPVKASEDRQSFSISIEPGSFEELFAYDHLRFEVADESTYRRSDADEHWDDVKLEHGATEGIYTVTFTNSKRKVSYKVRPVLQGADYDAALKVFNEKNKAYEQALKQRLANDQLRTDSINAKNKALQEKWNAENEWNNKINELILARNKKLKEIRQMKIDSIQKLEQAMQVMAQDQFLRIEREQQKYSMDIRLSAEVMRTFTINNFGVWNCDHPNYPNKEIPITATFKDSLNNKITFTDVAIVYKKFNGLTQYPVSMPIRVMPDEENTIWSIKDTCFYYFTYKDFMQTGITKESRVYTFKMRRSKNIISSYTELRELIDKL